MPKQRRSVLWSHFEKIPGSRARCEYCLENVSISGGSTGNLKRHLRNRHSEIKVESEEPVEKNSCESAEMKGASVEEEDNLVISSLNVEYREEDTEILKAKKRSKIWVHFKMQPNGKPRCLHCYRDVSITSGSTGNLIRHLKVNHALLADKDQNGDLNEGDLFENSMIIPNSEASAHESDELENCIQKKKRRSRVWAHFNEIGPSRARCEYCSKIVSFGQGSTGNLVRHLKTQHHRIVSKNIPSNESSLSETVSGDPIVIDLGFNVRSNDDYQSEYIELPEIEKRGLYDLCIIGAGLIGSAAARHASANPALNVVLVGPDESNKDGRKCAKPFCSYHNEESVVTLADEQSPLQKLIQCSSHQFKELEKISGKLFYFRKKALVFGENGHPGIEHIKGIMAQRNVAVSQVSNSSDLLSRYPYLQAKVNDIGISEDANAGYIDEYSLKEAQLKVAEIQGCEIVHDIVQAVLPVRKIGLSFCHKVILENRCSIYAKRVLICTGAFTKFRCLVPDKVNSIPLLSIKKGTAALFEISAAEAEKLREMPVIKYFDPTTPTGVYILPPVLVPDNDSTNLHFIKVCGNIEEPNDSVAKTVEDISEWYQSDGSEKTLEKLLSFLSSVLPGVGVHSVKSSPYITCQTISSMPYIDRLTPTVSVAVGGGMKSAASSDEVGRIAAELAVYGRWDSEVPQSLFSVVWQAQSKQNINL